MHAKVWEIFNAVHCTGEEVEMVWSCDEKGGGSHRKEGDENRRAGEEQEMVGQCGSRR